MKKSFFVSIHRSCTEVVCKSKLTYLFFVNNPIYISKNEMFADKIPAQKHQNNLLLIQKSSLF